MKEVTISELKTALVEGAFLLDVREPHEFDEAHVPGAVLIPLGEVADRVEELPDDVWVICRSGKRSITGAEAIVASGRTACSVAGGTLAWIDAGHPVSTGPTT
ncbi:MAG TPA: rhodanese-like domain-containing protein [Tessaracoccus flavescens]|uniref:Rhodanese-like domain-containing protein n=1 Tax=Tessaracoccus flavescens TaxID=399497 RepID=A0A921JQI0_9ACTN|nr:rhodanese-like domain-containing protein [Tessaracoccus flavescens]